LSIPDVVLFAVSLSISDEAGAELVEELTAVVTAKTGGMPLHVWGHTQQVLVNNALFAPDTGRHFLIKQRPRSTVFV